MTHRVWRLAIKHREWRLAIKHREWRLAIKHSEWRLDIKHMQTVVGYRIDVFRLAMQPCYDIVPAEVSVSKLTIR